MNRREFLKLSTMYLCASMVKPSIVFSSGERYKYGLESLIGKDIEFIINPLEGKLYSPNFFEYKSSSNSGLCRELMCKEFSRVKDQTFAYRCMGNEPNYFSQPNTLHFFLLEFDKKPSVDFELTTDSKLIEEILKDNPLVNDPSFNLRVPYSKSNYKVRGMLAPQTKYEFITDLLIDDGSSIFLGISNGHLVVATFEIKNPELFTLRLVKDGMPYSKKTHPSYFANNVSSNSLEIFEALTNAKVRYGLIPKTRNIYVSGP